MEDIPALIQALRERSNHEKWDLGLRLADTNHPLAIQELVNMADGTYPVRVNFGFFSSYSWRKYDERFNDTSRWIALLVLARRPSRAALEGLETLEKKAYETFDPMWGEYANALQRVRYALAPRSLPAQRKGLPRVAIIAA